MKRPHAVLFSAFLASALFSVAVHAGPGAHGPNGEHLDGPAGSAGTATAPGLARLADGSVNVPKQAQRRMAIRTQTGLEESHPVTVELNGRVTIDPNAGGRVQAPFAGQLEGGTDGLPVAGQRVRKGQVLAYLRATVGAIERGNQQALTVELRTARTLVQQRLRRLESLEGVVPQKETEAARAELASLTGRERAVSSSVGGREAIRASATGIIAVSNALNGQIVDERDVLFEIIDPNRLLIEARTSDVAMAGTITTATLAGLPGVELQLLGVGRSLSEGAVPVNFRARSQDAALAVGQPVTVLARLNRSVKGIRLPSAALARNPANETVVWIKASAERFIAQPVEAKAHDAATVVVTKGLGPENRVVVSGAALINQIR